MWLIILAAIVTSLQSDHELIYCEELLANDAKKAC